VRSIRKDVEFFQLGLLNKELKVRDHLKVARESAVLTLVTRLALTDTIGAGASTHTVSKADVLTSTSAESLGIGAVDGTLVASNANGSLLGANNLLGTNSEGQSRTGTLGLEAVSSLGSTRGSGQSTSEALTVSGSTESLETGKSGIIVSIRVVAIIVNVRLDVLASVGSVIATA